MDERLCWINLIFVPIRGSQKSGSGKQQDIVRHRRQIPPDARIPVSPQMLVEHLMQRGKSATASTRHSTPASRHKRIRFLCFAFAFSTGCAECCGISCLFCVFPRTSSSSETPNSSLSRIMLSKPVWLFPAPTWKWTGAIHAAALPVPAETGLPVGAMLAVLLPVRSYRILLSYPSVLWYIHYSIDALCMPPLRPCGCSTAGCIGYTVCSMQHLLVY